jgi:hypothetical protein
MAKRFAIHALVHSGYYGDPPSYHIWGLQSAVWLSIIAVQRFFMAMLFSNPFMHKSLNSLGLWALAPFSSNESLKITFVVMIWPPITGIVEFWIQDNFLKSSRLNGLKYQEKEVDHVHRYGQQDPSDMRQELLMIDSEFVLEERVANEDRVSRSLVE